MTFQAIPLPQAHKGRGIALMLLAMTLVPMIDVFAKRLGQEGLAAVQIIFMRMAFGSLFLLPMMLWSRASWQARPGEQRGWLQPFLLGLSMLGTGIFFFTALKYLSIADTLAISFVQPLFVTLASRFLLKERVDLYRWIALLVGFCATLVIIRPSSSAFDPASLYALASGACMAAYAIVVRAGAGRRPAILVTFQTHAITALLAIPLLLWVWQTPTLAQWGSGVALALVGLVGQYLIIRAYEYCEASLLAPLSYTEIVTSTLASWWFFNQLPDQLTFAGVAVLIGCAIVVTRKA